MRCPKCNFPLYQNETHCQNCGFEVGNMAQNKKTRNILICVSLVVFAVAIVGSYLSSQSKQSNTKSYNSSSQSQSYASREIYNKNGIKVVCLGLDDSGYLPQIAFKIENNSDYDIFISTDKLSINDYMINRSLYCEVAKGKKALDGIVMFSSDLSDLGIARIRNIEFTLEVSEADNYGKSPIDDSKLVRITY